MIEITCVDALNECHCWKCQSRRVMEKEGERERLNMCVCVCVRWVERALPSLMHVDQHKGIITKQFGMWMCVRASEWALAHSRTRSCVCSLINFTYHRNSFGILCAWSFTPNTFWNLKCKHHAVRNILQKCHRFNFNNTVLVVTVAQYVCMLCMYV